MHFGGPRQASCLGLRCATPIEPGAVLEPAVYAQLGSFSHVKIFAVAALEGSALFWPLYVLSLCSDGLFPTQAGAQLARQQPHASEGCCKKLAA